MGGRGEIFKNAAMHVILTGKTLHCFVDVLLAVCVNSKRELRARENCVANTLRNVFVCETWIAK